MGLSRVAYDPSAPDYGGTSPASLGRRMKRRYANAVIPTGAERNACAER